MAAATSGRMPRGHQPARDPLGTGDHLRDGRLPLAGGLPDLVQVVPHVARLVVAEDVAAPGTQQVGPGHGDVRDVRATEVVPDQVDRIPDCLQLTDEPRAVLLDRGAPPVR